MLDQARKCLLQDNDSFSGVAGSHPLLSNSDTGGPNGLFPSLSTSWETGIEDCSLFDSLQFPGELYGIEQFEPVHLLPPVSLPDTSQSDDLSQWLADSSKLCVTGLDLEAMLSDDIPSNNQGKQPASSSQNSLTNAFDFGYGELGDVVNAVEDNKINTLSGHGPKKGLFSELGLDHLLTNGCSSGSSSIEDQWQSSKKRKTEPYQTTVNNNNQMQQSFQSWGVKVMQPTSTGVQMQDFGSLKECMAKSQGRLWIDESYSGGDAKSCISGANIPSKPEEPPKATKKRARPGESTRPRPKDRQLIADRIKDLRDLIPNGAKVLFYYFLF